MKPKQITIPPKPRMSNKRVIKALVIGLDKPIEKNKEENKNDISILKQEKEEERGKDKKVPIDEWAAYVDCVIAPPYELTFLSALPEYSTSLRQCIEAMEVNIEGFGYRFDKMYTPKQIQSEKTKNEIENEFFKLKDFFENIGGEESLVNIRRKIRHDIETTGNGYFEVIRSPSGKIDMLKHVPGHQVRLGKLDNFHTAYKQKRLVLNPNGSRKWVERVAFKRFRRYLQSQLGVLSGTGGSRMVWFKEFGDPRNVNCETGEYVEGELPDEKKATELIHLKIYSPRTPYGVPRYIGCLVTLLGDREAEEVNYCTISNNNIPSMIVAVSNGMLTEETVDRMKDFVNENIEGNSNYSRFLIIEAETVDEGTDTGQSKIDVKPLANVQNKDQLFQEYGARNRKKIREAWRLPPIFLGQSEEYNRATADTSRKLADEQIFRPERDEVDHIFKRITDDWGAMYHRFVSNGPNITNDEDLLKLLVAAEKTGAMTPRVASFFINDIVGKDIITTWSEDLDPDIPFSLQMAEAVKNKAKPNEVSQQVTALKNKKKDQ